MTPPFGRTVTIQVGSGWPYLVTWPKRGQIVREIRRLEVEL